MWCLEEVTARRGRGNGSVRKRKDADTEEYRNEAQAVEGPLWVVIACTWEDSSDKQGTQRIWVREQED